MAKDQTASIPRLLMLKVHNLLAFMGYTITKNLKENEEFDSLDSAPKFYYVFRLYTRWGCTA